jgi:hypothetical protein
MGDWCIDFADLTVENLATLMKRLWDEREGLRERMLPVVAEEKRKARASVGLVSRLLGP